MNWYNKIAGIKDFYSGSFKQVVSTFPKNEQDLTEEQRLYLSRISTTDMYVLDQTELFRVYPTLIFYTMYNLERYILYKYNNRTWNDDIAQLANLIKSTHRNFNPINDLPNEIYELFTQDPEGWGINEQFACEVFKYQTGYPEFFLDWMKEKFPEAYNAKNSSMREKVDIVKNFLSFGTLHNFNLMEVMMSSMYPAYKSPKDVKMAARKKIDSFTSKIYPAVLNHEAKFRYVSRIIQRKKEASRYSFSGKGKEVSEIIYKVLENYYDGKEYFDDNSPFSLFFDTPSELMGTIPMLFYEDRRITVESLTKIDGICFGKPEDYFSLEFGRRTDPNSSSREETNKLFLVYETSYEEGGKEQYIDVGESASLQIHYGSYTAEGPIKAIYGVVKPRDQIRKDVYWEWFETNLQTAKNENREEEFLLSIVESQLFAEILESASGILGSLYISNATMIEENDYDPDASYDHNTQLPFMLDLANKLMDQLPPYMKTKIPTTIYPTWYYLCSGRMPCQFVYESAMKHPTDTMKVVEHIACSGKESESIKEKVRTAAAKVKREATANFKEKIQEFVSNPENCKMAKISDFPDLYGYTLELVSRHMDAKKTQWSPEKEKDVSLPEVVMSKIEKAVIYLINKHRMVDFFGAEQLQLSGYSPEEASGVFSPQYGFSENHDSIIVYVEGNYDSAYISMIINDVLGLTPEPSEGNKIKKVTEEGTLWHEVSHAALSSMTAPEEIANFSQWLQSPSELMAIQYGNLQHMKRKLHTFFENNIPASAKIEAGLIAHLESEIIETFSLEFHGMPKEQALMSVRANIEDFKEDVVSARTSLSKEESVALLTDIFLEFFMGKMMRGKSEDEIEAMGKLIGLQDQKMEFKEEIVVPETYEYRSPGQKDEIIAKLETREDYRQFISNVKQQISEYQRRGDFRGKERLKFYFHRTDPTTFKEPREFSDLLALLFEAPSSLLEVDLTKTNHLFDDIIPASLKNDVIDIVENKRRLLENPIQEKERLVTPEEAEDTGKFMVEMDREYGPDWMWTAKTNGWYKKAIEKNR